MTRPCRSMILLYKRWESPRGRLPMLCTERPASRAMNWRASGVPHGYCSKQLSYGVNQPVVSIKVTISVL